MVYAFYLDSVLLPVAPSAMSTKINNQNKTINLINDGEVNILKTAGLTEISFECMIPQVRYPFAVYPNGFKEASFYLSKIEKLKIDKKPFQFIVSRVTPSGKILFDTNMKVSLEEYEIDEDAENGLDLLISIKLKQYRPYGLKTVKIKVPTNNTKKKAHTKNARPTNKTTTSTYTIVSGDTLWAIAKKKLTSGTRYKEIYNLNKSVIEAEAKRRGRKSSSSGHWIYPGTKLKIPAP
ncbi:LysM peptidoglycan-binding domain-containing protein [Robertmurraya massiliosenegalensis]|uniref:LysM peptidoglycan-binding domain-containing protein n=1 Tax=Robertmurraya TaxID=2837507 RepID=UPI0039A6C5AE